MIDYAYLYKDCITLTDLSATRFDVFLSAYNTASRINDVFNAANSETKIFVIHREYGIGEDDRPVGHFFSDAEHEDEFIFQLFEKRLPGVDFSKARICLDITGFLRPHLMFLLRFLSFRGCQSLTAIYAEPRQYSKLDDTRFGTGQVHTVREVRGYEGLSANSGAKDLLIVGSGFEDRLVAEVAEDKDRARRVVLLGLPSLKADMYQQGLLRTRRARDALGENVREIFAPASDPFATASLLSEIVERERVGQGIGRLYLSPISTKPSALGFALFYLRECEGTATSIIFPFSSQYTTDASEGIGRIWKYEVEF
ncbi:hypothetical protein [Stagnihabitans tardus]|uniref:Uncharacterized protein n=1 Tax=Stagnihabitans tardus TaxID=2699202 RepID=A0AAE4YAU6_9RHOB|nr:hypothetical protein [Stagnihabitans tardus]NBZ89247.1 hypothetical protein [Stagnihabitans tardus]